jgi:hypothetical protein
VRSTTNNSVNDRSDDQAARQVGEPWTDKFGRRREPSQIVIDDGIQYHGEEAVARAAEHFRAVEAHNRQYVERLTPRERGELERYLLTREVPRRAPARTVPRPRGAGRPAVRRSASRSSSRTGDSGDDDPEPPGGGDPGGRFDKPTDCEPGPPGRLHPQQLQIWPEPRSPVYRRRGADS